MQTLDIPTSYQKFLSGYSLPQVYHCKTSYILFYYFLQINDIHYGLMDIVIFHLT